MRDHDDLPYVVIERRSAGFGPFLWGALFGAGAALLMAPRSGPETQQEIRDRVRKIREGTENRVESVRTTVDRTRSRVEDQIVSVRDQVQNMRSQIDEKAGRAKESIDGARQAARDAKTELERRVSDVRGKSVSPSPAVETTPSATPEVVVIDVSEEQSDGRADLG